jgi:hypothetical protein
VRRPEPREMHSSRRSRSIITRVLPSHRPIRKTCTALRAGDDLEDASARKDERTLSQALTL